jgi:hypothetical protein
MVASSSVVDRGARALLALAVACYAALRLYSFHHVDSDENIYFYMAVRTSFDGLQPYRDYFFAHPPLHLYLAVAAFKLVAFIGSAHGGHPIGALTGPTGWAEGGLALATAKSLGSASGAITALFVYRAARRFGALEALAAAACFLFAPDVLAACFTGTMEAVAFLAIAVERVVAGRDRQAGLAFAAATAVALYAAPAGLAVFVVLLALSRRRALALALWTGVPLLLVHGAFVAWAGRAYFDAVFAYHFRKPPGGGHLVGGLAVLFRHDGAFLIAIPLALAASLLESRAPLRPEPIASLRGDPRRQLVVFCFAAVAATLLVLAAGKAFFGFYLLTALATAWRTRRSVQTAAVATFILASVGAAGEGLAASTWLRRKELPDEAVGGVVEHRWRRARSLGALDGVVRALFFRDRQRLGERAPGITRYLWSMTYEPFDFAAEAAVNVRRAVPATGTLFGESTVVPLVALASGRRLALDEADTNDMRFRSGVTPPAAFVARLRRAPPDAVIFGLGDPVPHLEPFASWLREGYDAQLVQVHGNAYALYTRTGRPPLVPDLPTLGHEPQAMGHAPSRGTSDGRADRSPERRAATSPPPRHL